MKPKHFGIIGRKIQWLVTWSYWSKQAVFVRQLVALVG